MLISLSQKKMEELLPLVATGAQYKYTWGKFSDFLRRILISIAALASILLIRTLFGSGEWQDALQGVTFFMGLFALVYWLWSPVLQASLRNYAYRRFKYAGFFRGEVLDVYVTEEVVGTEENVNNRGELVVVENRERRINLEVGDETGFTTLLQVPLRQEHQSILPGDDAECVVLSNRPDLGRIEKVTDIWIPRTSVWVSDYPYLRRDEFEAVSRELEPIVEGDDRRYDARRYDEPRSNRRSMNERPVRNDRRIPADSTPRRQSRQEAYYDDEDDFDTSPRQRFLERRQSQRDEYQSDYDDFDTDDRDEFDDNRPRRSKRIPKTGANGSESRRDRRDDEDW